MRSTQVNDAVRRLGSALRVHHLGTAEHSHRCARLAGRVGRRLGLTADEVFEVQLVALLHDVGKLMVDPALLDHRGVLTACQRARLCEHAAHGGAILAGTPALKHLAEAVRATHERFDGSGYPDGLSGDEIPPAARIVACADAFDAMSASRAYRRALPRPEAIRRLADASASQFDPAVVDALLETLGAWAPALAA